MLLFSFRGKIALIYFSGLGSTLLYSSEVRNAFYDYHHLSHGEWISYAEKSPLLPLKRTSSLTSIDIFATANTPLRSEQFHYRGCETSCAMNNFAIAVAIATLRSEQFRYRGCETPCAVSNFAIAVAIATLRSEQFHDRGCDSHFAQ